MRQRQIACALTCALTLSAGVAAADAAAPASEPLPASVTQQMSVAPPANPEPLWASGCTVWAMTSCDNGTWLSCSGNACDFGWKWVWCDGNSYVCPECSFGGPCL